MAVEEREQTPHPLMYFALAAFIMAYGWGYRGTVGHEGGAMAPGALLGLALCLGSGRLDWHRRAALAGLFAAIGWAWGGSLSYMEHTGYVLSYSFPDVLYGYTILFFLGALWVGIGGGVLGLAFTERRSELERLIRPFTVICAVFLAVYLYFFFMPERAEAYETLTVREFHNGDWLSATIVLIVSGVYWLARPADRSATALFFWGAVAWWIGYLGFTKFGGLRLAPLHRSESWGGVVGILVVLTLYLIRRRNRAALMLCLYGIVGGGAAFAFAVFIRHRFVADYWGVLGRPILSLVLFLNLDELMHHPTMMQLQNLMGPWPQWRIAEDSFGFFMGLAIAIGARRLIRGGLAPAQENTPRARLDAYAVFAILVAITWVNFRRHVAPWLPKTNASDAVPFLGVPAWAWFVLGGALATLPLLYGLMQYSRGDRRFVPQSAFGKGVAATLILVWITVAGYMFHEPPKNGNIGGHLMLWVPAAVGSCLLLSRSSSAQQADVPSGPTVSPSDPKWKVGLGYWTTWAAVPVFLFCISELGMAMQTGPIEGMSRKRFGPDAYWRQTERLIGTWQAVGIVRKLDDKDVRSGDAPLKSLEFDSNRNVTACLPSGEVVSAHRWFLKNQYTWLQWYGKVDKHAERAEVPLQFRDKRLYIVWPPDRQNAGYLVLERLDK